MKKPQIVDELSILYSISYISSQISQRFLLLDWIPAWVTD